MFNRRMMLLSVAALPLSVVSAAAQEWWNQKREDEAWRHEAERERRLAEEHHEHWEEARAHAEWEKRQRVLAQ